jgi:hypothetical protein
VAHIRWVLFERFYRLELEFRVLTLQMANCANAADHARLNKFRDAIVVEARKIVSKLNIPEPRWCSANARAPRFIRKTK